VEESAVVVVRVGQALGAAAVAAEHAVALAAAVDRGGLGSVGLEVALAGAHRIAPFGVTPCDRV